MRTDLSTASFKGTAFLTSCLILNFNKQWENVAGATDMFRFRFVVQISTRTQYLHFLASKKTKARKNNKVKSMQNWNRQCFFFSFRNRQVMWWGESGEKHCRKQTAFNFKVYIHFNWCIYFFMLLLPVSIELWRCFEMFCYCHLRVIYIYMLPLTKNIFFFSFATGLYLCTQIHILMDSSNPSSILISPWFGSFAVGTHYWGKQVQRAGRCWPGSACNVNENNCAKFTERHTFEE